MPRFLLFIYALLISTSWCSQPIWAQLGLDGSTRFTFSSETLDRVDILIDEDSLALILQNGNEQSDYDKDGGNLLMQIAEFEFEGGVEIVRALLDGDFFLFIFCW